MGEPSDAAAKTLCEMLLWARANGFRVTEIAHGGVEMTVDDLRIEQGAAAETGPKTPHGLWARELGLKFDEVEDDDPESAVPQ
jgi:hypothetical protein